MILNISLSMLNLLKSLVDSKKNSSLFSCEIPKFFLFSLLASSLNSYFAFPPTSKFLFIFALNSKYFLIIFFCEMMLLPFS